MNWSMVDKYTDGDNSSLKELVDGKLTIVFAGVTYPPWDTEKPHVRLRVSKGGFAFSFWLSVVGTNKYIKTKKLPSKADLLYSVLCSVGSDIYIPDRFKDFCAEFGYNSDSIRDKAIWEQCLEHKEILERMGFTTDMVYPS
jgi:hypothetical protein